MKMQYPSARSLSVRKYSVVVQSASDQIQLLVDLGNRGPVPTVQVN